MDVDQAKDEADATLLPTYRKKFLTRLSNHLIRCHTASKSALYRRIEEDIEDTESDEKCDYEEAVKMVLKKRKYAFDKFLEDVECISEEEQSDTESVS